jgi:protein-disulfide isomerase
MRNPFDNSLLNSLATATLVACAVVVTSLVARRELFPSSPPLETKIVPDWRTYADEGQRMGPRDAAVTIVTFSDFQCPACRVFDGYLHDLRARHPDDLAIVFRHFPLPTHADAMRAAQASECAGRQGRFEAFHDALFAGQDSIGALSWESFAREAGRVEPAVFERCLGDSTTLAAIDRDLRAGRRLGVTVTPSFLVNRTSVAGAPSLRELNDLVNEALASAKR